MISAKEGNGKEVRPMDDKARNRCNRVWDMAHMDGEYHQLGQENRTLERIYFSVLNFMPIEQQDRIQNFLMNCEGMSWRMLEVACEKMIFAEEK